MAQSLLIVLMQHHNIQSDPMSYSSTLLCLLTRSWPSISIIKTFTTLLYLCIVLLHCAYVDLCHQRPNLVTGLSWENFEILIFHMGDSCSFPFPLPPHNHYVLQIHVKIVAYFNLAFVKADGQTTEFSGLVILYMYNFIYMSEATYMMQNKQLLLTVGKSTFAPLSKRRVTTSVLLM